MRGPVATLGKSRVFAPDRGSHRCRGLPCRLRSPHEQHIPHSDRGGSCRPLRPRADRVGAAPARRRLSGTKTRPRWSVSSRTRRAGTPSGSFTSRASLLAIVALAVVGRTFTDGPAREWARVGDVLLALTGAVAVVAVLVGAGLEEIADAWATAAPPSREAYLASYDTTHTVWTLVDLGGTVGLGLYLTTFAAAVLSSRVYARWLGWASAAAAPLIVVGLVVELRSTVGTYVVHGGDPPVPGGDGRPRSRALAPLGARGPRTPRPGAGGTMKPGISLVAMGIGKQLFAGEPPHRRQDLRPRERPALAGLSRLLAAPRLSFRWAAGRPACTGAGTPTPRATAPSLRRPRRSPR